MHQNTPTKTRKKHHMWRKFDLFSVLRATMDDKTPRLANSNFAVDLSLSKYVHRYFSLVGKANKCGTMWWILE